MNRRTVAATLLIAAFPGSARPQEPSDYSFRGGTFRRELWVADKRVFTRPKGVDVEFTSSGAFDWVFAEPSGREVRTLHAENAHGGWTSVDFGSLGLRGDHSIGFRNSSSKPELVIKQGLVRL